MKREIFRTAALNRMSSPEQLDQMLQVTSSRSWIALVGIGIILTGGVIWSLVGQISTKTPGRGVVIRSGNLVTVGSLGAGRVLSVSVHTGDTVRQGQMIAQVSQPLLADKLEAAESDLEKLRNRQKPQSSLAEQNLGLEMSAIDGQRSTMNQQIATLQDVIREVDAQIASTQGLYDKGLVTRQQVTALRERKAELANQISSLRVQLMQLRGTEFKAQIGKKTSDVEVDSRVRDAETNVKLMRADYDLESRVVSPYDGEVVQVQALPGTLVAQGSTIVSLQPSSLQMEVVAYLPATSSKAVHPGMQAEIMPTSVRPEEYGFIRGTVATVADYPATDVDLMTTFQNSSLTQAMTSGGPVTEVRLRIIGNEHTSSGFQWSSKNGPPGLITVGTLCGINVLTEEQRPIRLLFPYVKAKLGVY